MNFAYNSRLRVKNEISLIILANERKNINLHNPLRILALRYLAFRT